MTESAEPVTSTPSARDETPVAESTVKIPDSPVGRHVTWLLGALKRLPLAEEELADHFAPEYLDTFPVEQTNAFLSGIRSLEFVELTKVYATRLEGRVVVDGVARGILITMDETDRLMIVEIK
ncbi:Cpe/LpqF family protein [Rhizohabitans arisaemae]|uniref:Cpe/LpqF family protein n=1 Tax=Rhizohabitans arisaemae TaxID=2720610 RepID=UPI0024B18C35|nr:Cpe/LpqF family protein [Rhizohabitans arisaemae]